MRPRRLFASLRCLSALALLALPSAARADVFVVARPALVPYRPAVVVAPRFVAPYRPAVVVAPRFVAPYRPAVVPLRPAFVPGRVIYRRW